MYVPNDIIHVCVKSINTKSHQLLLFILMFVFDLLYMYLPLSMQCILSGFFKAGTHMCWKHGTMYRCTGLKKNTAYIYTYVNLGPTDLGLSGPWDPF